MANGATKHDDDSFDLAIFLWRRRRFIIGMALLGLVGGIVATLVVTPRYKSEVVLFPAITNSVSKALLSEQSTGRDDILALGETLASEAARLEATLPLGMELHKVSDQPAAVRESVGEFVKVLAEAVVIVLLVCFFSLGLRTGLVVAVSIPLVLAMTFALMHWFGIGLHKVSLGALVLALGLLVDDAIIAVEMMAIRMEQGDDRLTAASHAWSHTAFPMLTGTLVTAAGFLPIATAASSVGEYTRSLFQVVAIALVVSWIAAVLFIPWLGDRMLPDFANPAPPRPGSVAARNRAWRLRLADRWPRYAFALAPSEPRAHDHDPYQRPFYRRLRRLLDWCLVHRWLVIIATVALLALSLLGFRFVPQQFFPDSQRLELMVDLELAEGSSLRATSDAALRLEALLADRPGVDNHVAYIGSGSPRFYLPLDQQLPQANLAQFVVLARDVEAREALRDWLIDEVAPRFPELQLRVTRLENGPPVGYPVQFRVSGEHADQARVIAREVADKVRANPHVANVNLDWDEPSKVVRLVIDQDRARVLGVDSQQLARFLSASLSGQAVSVYREGNELIEVLMRGPADERTGLAGLGSLVVHGSDDKPVPLSQVARLEYAFEDGIIWHRDRLPTVTVRADVRGDAMPASVVAEIMPTLEAIRAALPPGYLLETGGTMEDSARGQDSIRAGMPLFLFAVATLLMLQLRSFSRSAMVFATAPLGLVGAVLFLLVFRVPFGFVALLGTIALAGMVMRNSIILVDFIEMRRRHGLSLRDAVVEAGAVRFRPMLLTALAGETERQPALLQADMPPLECRQPE